MNRFIKKNVVLVHSFDPLGNRVGGIENFIKGFIRYAPKNLCIEQIGATSSINQRPIGKWHSLQLGNTDFKFYPICHQMDYATVKFIPESLSFTLKISRLNQNIQNKVIIFNRIEHAMAYMSTKNFKVAIIHDDVIELTKNGSDSTWRYTPFLYQFMEKKVLHSLDLIYTVSTKTGDYYREKYPSLSDKIKFLPTWVDQNLFSVSTQPKLKIREEIYQSTRRYDDFFWILFVGRLQPPKDPMKLIETFFHYRKMNKKSCLMIIGSGDLKDKMIQYAKKLQIHKHIHFFGNKTQKELVKFYQASDVLLLTSKFECMPMCCLESLGCGLPVVSTNVGEIKRIVKNGYSGIVSDDASAHALAKAILEVSKNKIKFNEKNCSASVSDYTPPKVLSPVYDSISNQSIHRRF